MFVRSLVAIAVSCAAALSNARPLEERQGPTVTDTFDIYAYGEGISGLPLFYADGVVQFGDASLSSADVVVPVYFTVSETSPNTWLAHANITDSGLDEPPFDTVVFTLPPADASGTSVTFEAPTTSLLESEEADSFDVYGNYVLLSAPQSGSFYATSVGAAGLWRLVWSAEALEDIAITLRTIAPSTETVLE